MNPSEGFSRLFDSVRQAVAVTDGERIIYANPMAHSAFEAELSGLYTKNLFPAELLENKNSCFVCAANVLGRDTAMNVVSYGNGSIIYFDFPTGNTGAIRVTKSMINNLRNYAMGIKLSADRCFSGTESRLPKNNRFVSILYHNYYRLVRTITQIDTADQLDKGELVFSPVSTDIIGLCSRLTSTVKSLSKKKHLNIDFTTEEASCSAVVDPTKLEQLILCLFSVSLSHTSPGDSICLSLKNNGSKVILSMDDTGKGIPESMMGELFSRQERELAPLSPDKGSELSLFIAYGIAQLHKGVMLVESKDGEGTRIRVMLPSDESPAPKFRTPLVGYGQSGITAVLTELAEDLDTEAFDPKFHE